MGRKKSRNSTSSSSVTRKRGKGEASVGSGASATVECFYLTRYLDLLRRTGQAAEFGTKGGDVFVGTVFAYHTPSTPAAGEVVPEGHILGTVTLRDLAQHVAVISLANLLFVRPHVRLRREPHRPDRDYTARRRLLFKGERAPPGPTAPAAKGSTLGSKTNGKTPDANANTVAPAATGSGSEEKKRHHHPELSRKDGHRAEAHPRPRHAEARIEWPNIDCIDAAFRCSAEARELDDFWNCDGAPQHGSHRKRADVRFIRLPNDALPIGKSRQAPLARQYVRALMRARQPVNIVFAGSQQLTASRVLAADGASLMLRDGKAPGLQASDSFEGTHVGSIDGDTGAAAIVLVMLSHIVSLQPVGKCVDRAFDGTTTDCVFRARASECRCAPAWQPVLRKLADRHSAEARLLPKLRCTIVTSSNIDLAGAVLSFDPSSVFLVGDDHTVLQVTLSHVTGVTRCEGHPFLVSEDLITPASHRKSRSASCSSSRESRRHH